MIKTLLLLFLCLSLAVVFLGNITILFEIVSVGSTYLFMPLEMAVTFLGRLFSRIFSSYYLLVIIGIFLFIFTFALFLKVFVGVIENRALIIKENTSSSFLKSSKRRYKQQKYNEYYQKQLAYKSKKKAHKKLLSETKREWHNFNKKYKSSDNYLKYKSIIDKDNKLVIYNSKNLLKAEKKELKNFKKSI